jgi:hypothetical protein
MAKVNCDTPLGAHAEKLLEPWRSGRSDTIHCRAELALSIRDGNVVRVLRKGEEKDRYSGPHHVEKGELYVQTNLGYNASVEEVKRVLKLLPKLRGRYTEDGEQVRVSTGMFDAWHVTCPIGTDENGYQPLGVKAGCHYFSPAEIQRLCDLIGVKMPKLPTKKARA